MKLLERMREGARELKVARDRRKADRQAIPSRLVHLRHGQDVEPARCEDLSPCGARLFLAGTVKLHETVVVHFTPDFCLTGRVAWVSDHECGVEFAEPVDGPASRALALGSTAEKIEMGRFREGLNVKVILPAGERKAVLRWTRDEYVSLKIEE